MRGVRVRPCRVQGARIRVAFGWARHRRVCQPGEQLGQAGLEWGKQGVETGLAEIRLKGLGQDFPGTAGDLLGPGQLAGLLAPQPDQTLQGRRKAGEVVLAPGLLPEGIAARLGLGGGGDQAWIEDLLAPELQAPQLTIVDRLRGGAPIELRFCRGKQVGIGAADRTQQAGLVEMDAQALVGGSWSGHRCAAR